MDLARIYRQATPSELGRLNLLVEDRFDGNSAGVAGISASVF